MPSMYRPGDVSIPQGTINTRKTAVIPTLLDVSIPQGTINTLCEQRHRDEQIVSIPQGTINTLLSRCQRLKMLCFHSARYN